MILGGKNHFSRIILLVLVIAVLGTASCTHRYGRKQPAKPGMPKPYKVMGKWYQPLSDSQGFQQKGLASWYGRKFHGRKTANGERYNMYGVSAAHKTLPLGTWVRVRNLENRKSLDVRINDRGPFVRGRIIDLSYGAAKKINLVGPGTAKVEITALGKAGQPLPDGRPTYKPLVYNRGNFTIQVGAFKDRQNAAKFVQKLDNYYVNAHMVTADDGEEAFYRVLAKAAEFENYLVKNGFPDAFAVAE